MPVKFQSGVFAKLKKGCMVLRGPLGIACNHKNGYCEISNFLQFKIRTSYARQHISNVTVEVNPWNCETCCNQITASGQTRPTVAL